MHENLIEGEIQNELQRGANSRGNGKSKTAAERKLFNTKFEDNGIQPCGENNESESECNVNGKNNCGVCIGIERFVLVDEERNDLRKNVCYVCRNEQCKTATLPFNNGIIKNKPMERRCTQFFDRGDIVENCKGYDLNNTGTETDNNEFHKLPQCFHTVAFCFRALIEFF